MKNRINAFFLGNNQQNLFAQNSGFLILRFFVGLALCTVFEKFLPHEGIYGPQEWFIQDIANMGFPFPVFFAWVAVLSEFLGGIFMMLGLFTRIATLLNVIVTFTATFIYHSGDIGNSGLLSFFFLIMCICILLFGAGKYSLDSFVSRRLIKKGLNKSVIILLLLSVNIVDTQANSHIKPFQKEALIASVDSPRVEFYLKNNSLLPRKVIFIIYQPQQEGNNTLVKWFLPFQKVKFDLPINSKIYIASVSQVDIVMQGKCIDTDQPFLNVDDKINYATIQLRKAARNLSLTGW